MKTRFTILRACAIGTLTLGLALFALWSTGNFPPVALANSGGGVTYYTLTKCTPTGGVILNSPTGTTFVNNTVVTLTADPNPGYDFSAWTGAITGSTNPINLTMNANKSVCATFVVDNTLPTIVLVGTSPVYVECHGTYGDAGATANDNRDGNITSRIVVGGVSAVDVNTPGTYTITYNVKDDAENSAAQVTRTVIVQDTVVPAITLLGANPMTVFQGVAYSEAGATATDTCQGNLTENIVIGGSVNTATLGTYNVTYDLTDSAGNHAVQQVRTVNVIVDNAPPVITLLGDNPLHVAHGGAYEEPGGTALDNPDGDISDDIVIGGDTVDMNALGTYEVTYDVEDAVGNDAVQVVRSVIVADLTRPVITLAGDAIVSHPYGSTFLDPGATASDNIDGDLTSSIAVSGDTVNTNALGAYALLYDVEDAAGNEADQKIRIVEVRDSEIPVITILGDNPLTVAYQGTYTDPGATASDNVDGNLTSGITVGGDSVDPETPGTYHVTYDVSDNQENDAAQVVRTVNVPAPGPKILTVDGPTNGSIVITQPEPAVAVLSGAPDHEEEYAYGTTVFAQANPHAGYIFWEWGGDLDGEGHALIYGDSFDDESLDEAWEVDAGAWSENSEGLLQAATSASVSPAIRRVQEQDNISITYDYARLSGTSALENTLLRVDEDNRTWLEIAASQITLKEEVDGTPATLATASVTSDVEALFSVEIEIHDARISVWRGVQDGPRQRILSTAASTHRETTAIEWSTGTDTSWAFDNLEIRDLTAQASLEMLEDHTISATFVAADSTAPVITLLGDVSLSIDCGETFTDPGATASDNRYGDLTSQIVAGGDVVDEALPGVYEITYDVMDREGNAATQVTRTVTVTTTDVSLPLITRNGPAVVYLDLNATYNELGATASDICDNSLSAVTIDSSDVDTATYGAYTVTYNVSDAASNAAVEVTREVRVWPKLEIAVTGAGTGTTLPAAGEVHYFSPNSVVNVSAIEGEDSYFSEWTGDTVANSLAPATTITMNTAKGITAVFGNGHVVTLSVEGEGTLHYEVNSAPGTVTEAGGPVTIVVAPEENLLALEAEPESNETEFWQWLSDDPKIDETYIPDSAFTIEGQTEITASFAPEGAVDYIEATVEVHGEGTSMPSPGIHRLPRYAGTDLDCIEACQDNTTLPGGCAPCEYAALRVEAVPDEDWIFWEWHGGVSDEPVASAVASIRLGGSTNVTGIFFERPGLKGLNLVEDLADFLVETGANSAAAEVYDLDVDWGGFWVDYDDSIQFKGNDLPDAAEFALLDAILANPHLDLSASGGVAHISVWDTFSRNRTQAQIDLAGESAAAINAVAGYMTLGSYGHMKQVAAAVLDSFAIALDVDAYNANSRDDLGADEDADNDGHSNLAAWEQALAESPANGQVALAAFVSMAIDASSYEGSGTGDKRALGINKQVGEDEEDCDCPNGDSLTTGDLTVNSTGYVNASATVECVEDQLPVNEAVALPLGRKVNLSAAATMLNPFLGWHAPGTLIHGSFEASAEFVHVNAGQVVTPTHHPVSGITVLATADNFTYSGAVTGVETPLGGNWTQLKGNYGDVVTLTNPHGGGWEEASGDDFTLQNTISVTFGQLKNALRPVYGGVASTTLKHTGTAGGGGQVSVSVSDDGDDPYSPYPHAASSPRYAATDYVPHYAFFAGVPNPGWLLYDWHSSATKKPFELDPLYIFRYTAVAATAEFLPAAKLSLETKFKPSYGPTPNNSCIGYCVANPAAAYYSGNTVVRVTASAQPGYVFSHWEGSGKAWTTATGSSENWTVTGAGTQLKGQTSKTVYVKMGDDAVKPRPKDRELTAVFCPCIHEGDYWTGSLKGDTKLIARTGYLTHSDNNYGCLLWTLEKIKQIGEAWAENHDYKFSVGQISKPGGGDSDGGSTSHNNGLDVDVRYINTDHSGPLNVVTSPSSYDHTATQELVDLFVAEGATHIITVPEAGLNAGGAALIYDAPLHNDHFHVRFDDPD